MNVEKKELERLGLLGLSLPLAEYGRGEAKTVRELIDEINSGTCRIIQREGIFERLIRVVACEVVFPERGLILYEAVQVFADGRVRHRNQWEITEKLELGETYEEALFRGITEELAIAPNQLRDVKFVKKGVRLEEGLSYPGLTTRTDWQQYSAAIAPSAYRPVYIEVGRNKTTYFVWAQKRDG